MSAGQWCNAPYPRSAGSESPARDSRDLYSCRAQAVEFPRAPPGPWSGLSGGLPSHPRAPGSAGSPGTHPAAEDWRRCCKQHREPGQAPRAQGCLTFSYFFWCSRMRGKAGASSSSAPPGGHCAVPARRSRCSRQRLTRTPDSGDPRLVVPSFQATARLLNRGQTFRLNAGFAPAFSSRRKQLSLPSLGFLFHVLALLAPGGWRMRGSSRGNRNEVCVLVRVISCRAALAPPVLAFPRCSASLNCTSAPWLSPQCLAAERTQVPPMRSSFESAP